MTTTPMFRDAFIAELGRLGYQDGRDIEIHWRPNPTGGRQDVEDLVKLSPACLVLAGPTNLRYGRALTNTIPIITIDLETDPVADGIVRSLAHPGGNVTGIFLDLPELAGKQIQLLRDVLPALKRLAVLWQEPVGAPQLRAARSAASAVGVTIVSIGVRNVEELADAVGRGMSGKPEAVLVLTGPLLFPNRVLIVESALRHRLPIASVFPGFSDAGALLGYGPNQANLFRQMAGYVPRILKGARPADLPVERPTTFEMRINLKTAKALGLTIPPSLLQRADQVIE